MAITWPCFFIIMILILYSSLFFLFPHRFWFLSLVACHRVSSCHWEISRQDSPTKIRYSVWLVNGSPDSKHLNPFEHQFSFDEQDVIEIYLSFLLAYIVLLPIQVCVCWGEFEDNNNNNINNINNINNTYNIYNTNNINSNCTSNTNNTKDNSDINIDEKYITMSAMTVTIMKTTITTTTTTTTITATALKTKRI